MGACLRGMVINHIRVLVIRAKAGPTASRAIQSFVEPRQYLEERNCYGRRLLKPLIKGGLGVHLQGLNTSRKLPWNSFYDATKLRSRLRQARRARVHRGTKGS